MKLRHAAGLLVWLTTSGCAGSSPPATAPLAPAEVRQSPAVPIAAPESDRAPATAPDSLFAVARFSRPDALDSVQKEAGFRGVFTDSFRPFQNQIDRSQPVDLAWSVRLRVLRMAVESGFAIAATVRSADAFLEQAKSLDMKIEEPEPKVYRITRHRSDVCILDASNPSPRVVCADDATDTLSLSRYMVHTLPQEDLGDAEGVVEVRVEALARRLGDVSALEGMMAGWLESEARRKLPPLSAILQPVQSTVAHEALLLVKDTNRLRFELRLPTPQSVELRAVVSQNGQSAWLSQALSDQISYAGPPPEEFWPMAELGNTAWFTSRVHEPRYQLFRKELTDLLASEFYGIASPRETADLILRALLPHDAMAYAHGSVPLDSNVLVARGGFIRERAVSFFGWHILAIPYPAADVDKDLGAGMDAYNDGRLRTLVYRAVPPLCAGLPPIRRRAQAKGWPRGTKLFEMKMTKSFFEQCTHRAGFGAAAVPGLTIVVALVPNGQKSWVGVSADEPALLGAVKKVMAKRKTASGPLATASCVAGGVATPDALVDVVHNIGRSYRYPGRNLSVVPEGTARATWCLEASTTPESAATLTIRLPREQLREWIAATMGRWPRRRY